MTFEQCHANLLAIRRRQGTSCPTVRVSYNGAIYQGRVKRADSDPEIRPDDSPFGLIVLEQPGLVRGAETILQIANIPEDGIADLVTAH